METEESSIGAIFVATYEKVSVYFKCHFQEQRELLLRCGKTATYNYNKSSLEKKS